jgi:hypothetical protein
MAVGMLAALALGLTPAKAATGNLPLSLCSPDQDFVASPGNKANPYFPLTNDLNAVLVGPDGDETHGLRMTVEGTFDLYSGSLTTRVVREFEWKDKNADGDQDAGELSVEDSVNYFAQVGSGPNKGTVCYFGEDVTSYDDNGNATNHASGSWRADVFAPPVDCTDPGPGVNAPGIFMPVDPKPGMHFQQESAPCVALDVAQIVGVGTVKLSNGTSFPNAIRVKEGSLLEKGSEYKAYTSSPRSARGLIVDDGLELCVVNSNCPGS